MSKNLETGAGMVNLARYPLDDLSSERGARFLSDCRRQFRETGLCMLPEFIRPRALEALAVEASSVADQAYFCRSRHDPYLSTAEPDSDDQSREQEQTFVGSVPYDRLDPNSALRRLYLWDPLKDFIGDVLEKESFYRFADPLGACSINVFVDGGEHGWHFDESEYTVTLMVQPPEQGGSFEYVPQIRGREDESMRVRRALDGHRDGVVELPFSAGTLLIFGGRQTLHRVTRVRGNRPRLVPVLCYAEQPNLTNSVAVRELFWGRSAEEAVA